MRGRGDLTKKRKVESRPPVTKHQLSRWQRETRTRHIIQIAILVALASIVGVVTYGYYDTRVRPWHQPIVMVNDTTCDMRYYVKTLRLHGVEQYSQNLQQMMTAAKSAVGSIQVNELIRQLAHKLGIVVTPEEIEQEIENTFSGQESETDFKQRYQEMLKKLRLTDLDYREMQIEPELLRLKLREHIAKGVPKIALQVHVQAMLLGTEEEAKEIKTKLDSGEDFAQLAEDSSQHYASKEEGGDMGWKPCDVIRELIGPAFAEASSQLEPGEMAGPIYETTPWTQTTGGYWLIEVGDKNEEEKVYLRAILTASKEKAEAIRAELGDNPDDEEFAQLAKGNSLDSSSRENGGEVGWLSEEEIKSRFGEAALEVESGNLSEPIYHAEVSKRGGYWLIKAQDAPEEREISSEDRQVLVAKAFNEWFNEHQQAASLENYLNEEKIYWALGHIHE